MCLCGMENLILDFYKCVCVCVCGYMYIRLYINIAANVKLMMQDY